MSETVECTCEHCGKRFEATPRPQHRLLCGDATDPAAVERLMAGEQAGLVASDPPYGVSYDGNAHRREHRGGLVYDPIANDDLQGAALEEFLTKAFRAAAAQVTDEAAWYIWHASITRPAFLAALASVRVEVHQEIVWTKESFQFSRADYHWQHEPCLYGWRERHTFLGERNQSTVWQIPRQSEHQHPTTKPTELWRIPIRNHLSPGEIVLDLFLGSGPALIAAQQLGGRAFGMELSPAYVDVCVLRWQQLTGREARLEGDGRAFPEIARARLGGDAQEGERGD
ncbi:MAG: site-specific DNA-methyltransferase [Thermoleophilia bacterium]|nr:site-specific DNA-methyltransferase [Thermoleophilia bacterium]